MTESIAAEPALAERLVARLEQSSAVDGLARLLRTTAMRGEPVVVTGCGTSEHAALGIVEILRDAWRTAKLPALGGAAAGPVAAQAFELSLDPPTGGLVIGVSHEGGDDRHERGAGGGARGGCADRADHRERSITGCRAGRGRGRDRRARPRLVPHDRRTCRR